jgi:hypothetical protein
MVARTCNASEFTITPVFLIHARDEGSAVRSFNIHAKISPTISSLFFQSAFAFSGSKA